MLKINIVSKDVEGFPQTSGEGRMRQLLGTGCCTSILISSLERSYANVPEKTDGHEHSLPSRWRIPSYQFAIAESEGGDFETMTGHCQQLSLSFFEKEAWSFAKALDFVNVANLRCSSLVQRLRPQSLEDGNWRPQLRKHCFLMGTIDFISEVLLDS